MLEGREIKQITGFYICPSKIGNYYYAWNDEFTFYNIEYGQPINPNNTGIPFNTLEEVEEYILHIEYCYKFSKTEN